MASDAACPRLEVFEGSLDDDITAERRFDIPCEQHVAAKDVTVIADGATVSEDYCMRCGAGL